jgi:hypothetical protein
MNINTFGKLKEKKCKYCKDLFIPYTSFQKFCLKNECIIEHNQATKQKKAVKAKRVFKENDKSLQLKLCQTIVNKYVRLRDMNKPCVSCGINQAKWDAGHFFSQGGNPSIRFNTLNNHKQCFRCNRILSANLVPYRIEIERRIGLDSFNKLEAKRNDIAKYDVEYLHRLIKVFKKKIKLYENKFR